MIGVAVLWRLISTQHVHPPSATQVRDVDGRQKPLLFQGQYALHTWWRYVHSHCHAVPLYNLTYINTVPTLMNYLLRPLVADMELSQWPASPYADSPCQLQHFDY